MLSVVFLFLALLNALSVYGALAARYPIYFRRYNWLVLTTTGIALVSGAAMLVVAILAMRNNYNTFGRVMDGMLFWAGVMWVFAMIFTPYKHYTLKQDYRYYRG